MDVRRHPKIQRLLKALMQYHPKRVYLFGSWARGEADEASDIDLVIIKETQEPFLERLRTVGRLLPEGIGAVDVLVYTPVEWQMMCQRGNALTETIMEEGVLLYERSREASN